MKNSEIYVTVIILIRGDKIIAKINLFKTFLFQFIKHKNAINTKKKMPSLFALGEIEMTSHLVSRDIIRVVARNLFRDERERELRIRKSRRLLCSHNRKCKLYTRNFLMTPGSLGN